MAMIFSADGETDVGYALDLNRALFKRRSTIRGSVVQSTNTLSFPVSVAFNDALAVVTEQGLVVNSIGLYYIKVIIPDGVIGDSVTVKVAQNGKLIDQNLSGPTLVTAIGN